jgi:hypothetical protein
MGAVLAAWEDAVGEEIARNAWPARFQRDGTLVVHTKDAVWAFELGHRAVEVAARLPGRPPLKFVAGPLPEPGGEATAAASGPPPATLEEREQAAVWASRIEDEELRATVARAAAASLARQRG